MEGVNFDSLFSAAEAKTRGSFEEGDDVPPPPPVVVQKSGRPGGDLTRRALANTIGNRLVTAESKVPGRTAKIS